jgi:pimeloyl-ACP methyl ester carboxylesterase
VRPEPFTVAVPAAELDDLRRRLEATRWADDFGNEDWRYGVERTWLEDMVAYWGDEFDWRAQEEAINSFPQFRVKLDGIRVHFIHVRGTGAHPLPVILTHGWPWTFWDYKDVIRPLAAAGFDVVVPSLPGYGFSIPLRTTGVGMRRIGELWLTLMRDVLGYERFATAGGDIGAALSAELGHAHARHVVGVFQTMAMWPGLDFTRQDEASFADDEQWMRQRAQQGWHLAESHVTVQRIDPQTLAYAFVDSPVGTAAWIWERRRAWSDCDGDVLTAFDRDFLCTTASIYWLTRTIGTSFRLYYESFAAGLAPVDDQLPVIKAPTAISVFPKDIVLVPRSVAEQNTNLVRWSVMPRGGHFAPAEQPELVVQELTAFLHGLTDGDAPPG